jgi:hypothetical protein
MKFSSAPVFESGRCCNPGYHFHIFLKPYPTDKTYLSKGGHHFEFKNK